MKKVKKNEARSLVKVKSRAWHDMVWCEMLERSTIYKNQKEIVTLQPTKIAALKEKMKYKNRKQNKKMTKNTAKKY